MVWPLPSPGVDPLNVIWLKPYACRSWAGVNPVGPAEAAATTWPPGAAAGKSGATGAAEGEEDNTSRCSRLSSCGVRVRGRTGPLEARGRNQEDSIGVPRPGEVDSFVRPPAWCG